MKIRELISATRSKRILTILLVLFTIYFIFAWAIPSKGMSPMINTVGWILSPVFLSFASFIGFFSQGDAWGILVVIFLGIPLLILYDYFIACILIFIYQKIFRKNSSHFIP